MQTDVVSPQEKPLDSPLPLGPKWALGWLLLCSAGLHVWFLTHTEVAARDSVGFIRYAWKLEHEEWSKVFRSQEQHPGYPVSIWLCSKCLGPLLSGPLSVQMQFCAQWVSAVAGTLLVIPMFLLGRKLFDARVAFWGTLLFQCMPASARVLSDGLSEALFLLFAISALYLGVCALQSGTRWTCLGCGFTGALAYLTRPEGGLVVACTILLLILLQALASYRRAWLVAVRNVGLVAGAASLLALPFILTIGSLTPKTSVQFMTGQRAFSCTSEEADDLPTTASLFALWHDVPGPGPQRRLWAVYAVVLVLLKGLYYVYWLPAVGMFLSMRKELPRRPELWLPLLMCLVLCALLWRLAAVMGYVSDRHALQVLLCACFWSVAGVCQAFDRFFAARQVSPRTWAGVTLGALVLLIAVPLPKALKPLHYDRAGFRQAGLWLEANTTPTDEIVDPYAWSHYYAGRVFLEGRVVLNPAGHVPKRYVVYEQSKSTHDRLEALASLAQVRQMCANREPVYRCTAERGKDKAVVEVYCLPRQE